jgi:hypothetical protein
LPGVRKPVSLSSGMLSMKASISLSALPMM